jgi:hypothetical protein
MILGIISVITVILIDRRWEICFLERKWRSYKCKMKHWKES